jgi:hypothetical protein
LFWLRQLYLEVRRTMMMGKWQQKMGTDLFVTCNEHNVVVPYMAERRWNLSFKIWLIINVDL